MPAPKFRPVMIITSPGFPREGVMESTLGGLPAFRFALRFLRPVCYQNLPDAALPLELRNDNPRGIWRTVNGRFTVEAVG